MEYVLCRLYTLCRHLPSIMWQANVSRKLLCKRYMIMQVQPIVTLVDLGRANLKAKAAELTEEMSSMKSMLRSEVMMETSLCH